MSNTKSCLGCVVAFLLLTNSAVCAFADPKIWREQGPGPTLLDSNTVIPPNSPVSGAINAIAPSPTDPDLVYVGTVNGGIWKTTNATGESPVWTPLTDKHLPALSINSLAISPVHSETLFAGTGSTSSLAFEGSPGFGILRSTNGGKNWTVLASSTFAGRRINNIVPTILSNGRVVLAASLRDRLGTTDHSGVYRSTDKGNSFTRISGNGISGLPDAGVSSLIGDPSNANRFYAGVQSRFGGGSSAGVYRSDDGGVTWGAVNTGLTGHTDSFRILLSLHSSRDNNVVYAAIISNTTFTLSGVFRSTNQGDSWAPMGVPTPEIFPGAQGTIHGALLAHPADPDVVFVSGDRQNGPFPNANGCRTFNANIFRGDAAQLPGNPWQNVVCNGANGTAPHADSRAMVFDASGNLLHADDGGIYQLIDPDNEAGVRRWIAVNGDIRAIELHSVAYDPLSNIVFGGTQDNGTPIQTAPGEITWVQLRGGDGGNVAVDSDQTSHPGTTIRYTSSQFFGFFNRTTWNAANTRVGGFTQVQLRITSGPGSGLTLFQFDPNIQFYQPFVLNTIDSSRMLIGTANIYESLNKGDALANLGFTGFVIGDGVGSSPLAYGGLLNGVPYPDVFYVGAGSTIRHRVTLGGPITMLSAYPGGTVRTLAIDPQNYQTLYVVDVLNRVWASFNQGASWIDLTGNLATLSSDIRALAVVRLDASKHTVLIVGGLGGVFQRKFGTEGDSEDDDGWHALGKGLPPALVRDLHYNSANDILVAGTLGRGAWTLPNIFQGDSRRWSTAQGTEGLLTLANTPTVEASPAEGDKLAAGFVPPVAVLLGEDE
jgi:hypothetical protein